MFAGGLLRSLLFVLSADLLYLHYIGAWYDPIVIIEWVEVFLLITLCAVSILWTVRYMKMEAGKW